MAKQYRIDELVHYGVKGQKWGHRRYQNADGSLTPEGKKRYGNEENFEKQYPKDAKEAQVKGMKAAKSLTDGTKEAARGLNEIEGKRSRKAQAKVNKMVEENARDNARKMTDQELRDAVNRLNMEENYTRMVSNRERIELGESAASKFLDKTMTAMTLASTALTIALAIKELRK